MNGVKSDWPLLVFTICAPVCAGAWLVVALLAVSDALPGAVVLSIGWQGAVLCLLLFAGLACSTLHLGRPLRALRAFKRLGNSAVSNEVFVGSVFAVVTLLYLLIAPSLLLVSVLWKIALSVVAALAALFVLFQCLAYRMRTVLTWSSFPFSFEFALIALLGGVCVEGAAASATMPVPPDVRVALVAIEAFCCMGFVALVHAQGTVVVEGIATRRRSARLLRNWNMFSAVRVLAVAIGSVIWGCGMLAGEPSTMLAVTGAVLVLGGLAVSRYVFYRFYVNVGLPHVRDAKP